MTRLLIGWLWKPAGLLLAVWAVWQRGKSSAQQEAALEEAEGYATTRERMDDAEIAGDDPAAARRWLLERSQSGGNL